MSSPMSGRHRAPSRLAATPLARASTALVVSGGLVLSMSGGAQAAPAPAAVPAAPSAISALPATPVTLPATPVLSHPTTPTTWSNVRWGATGSTVKSIQRIVRADPDGVFGPKTHAAVKTWQSRNGLDPDGIVGPLTSRAMGLTGSSNTQSSTREASTSASRSSARTPPSSTSSSRSGVLAYAQQYTGIMYSWGGTSPSTGFDCSGYTQYVFAKVGIDLPRTAEAQRQFSTPVSSPQPGDLVFWGAPAWHMAIYAGDGMIYDSGRPGLPTQKRKMFSGVTSYGRVG